MGLLPAFSLLAETDTTTVLARLLDPRVLEYVAPVAAIVTAATVVGAITITRLVVRHRERMAKMAMGIDPDAPPQSYQDGSPANR